MLSHWGLPERALAEPFTPQMDLQSEKSVHYSGCVITLTAQAWRSWAPVLQERKKPQFVKSSSYQMEQGSLYMMACREDNWKLQSPAGLGSAESCMRWAESAIQGIFLCSPMQKNSLRFFSIYFYTEKNPKYTRGNIQTHHAVFLTFQHSNHTSSWKFIFWGLLP